MRQIYALLAGTLLILSGCSSSRKAAQTPDDVYYSPASANKAASASNGDDQDEYSDVAQEGDYYSTAPNDQYVRMKVQDPSRWSYFDDYSSYDSYYYSSNLSLGLGYCYPSYGYGLGLGYSFGLGFGDPYLCWNDYFLWNSWYNPYFYNPYYGGGLIVADGSKYGASGTNAVYSHLRAFNGTSYRNGLVTRTTSNSNERTYRPRTATSYYSTGTRNGIRQINNNSNNINNNSSNYRSSGNTNNYYRPSNTNSGGFSQPTRSYTPSSGGGGGGGFSRPGRH